MKVEITDVHTDDNGNVFAICKLPDDFEGHVTPDMYLSVGPLDEQMQPVDLTDTGENNKIIKRSN